MCFGSGPLAKSRPSPLMTVLPRALSTVGVVLRTPIVKLSGALLLGGRMQTQKRLQHYYMFTSEHETMEASWWAGGQLPGKYSYLGLP